MEGKDLLPKYEVYQVTINLNIKPTWISPGSAATVQHFHFKVNMYEDHSMNYPQFPTKKLLKLFGCSIIRRKSCSVSFENPHHDRPTIPLAFDVIGLLQSLEEFEKVKLSIKDDWVAAGTLNDNWRAGPMLTDQLPQWPTDERVRTINQMFDYIYRFWNDSGIRHIVGARAGRRQTDSQGTSTVSKRAGRRPFAYGKWRRGWNELIGGAEERPKGGRSVSDSRSRSDLNPVKKVE